MNQKITITIGELLEGALKENKENLDNITALGITPEDEHNDPMTVFTVEREIKSALCFPYTTYEDYGQMPYFCAWTEKRIYIFHGEFAYSGDGAYDDYRTKIISAPINPATGARLCHSDL